MQSYEVLLCVDDDVIHQQFRSDHKDLLLGAVYRKDKRQIALLYTINRSQTIPDCTLCWHRRCKCWQLYEDGVESDLKRLECFQSRVHQ